MTQARWEDCYYSFQDGVLKAGNSCIEREWRIDKDALPVCVSLLDKRRGESWLDADASAYPMFNLPFAAASVAGGPEVRIDHTVDDDYGIAPRHWKISLRLSMGRQVAILVVRLYPNEPVMRNALLFRRMDRGPRGTASSVEVAGLALDENNKQSTRLPPDYVDFLPIDPLHCGWMAVTLRDVTDTNNNLVSEERGVLYRNEKRKASGNLLFVTNRLSGGGLIIVKEGPTPYGHLHPQGGDFQFIGRNVFVIGSGLTEADLDEAGFTSAYSTAVGVYDGTEYGGLHWLHGYYGCLRRNRPERDFFVMSNTWGDRSQDGRVSEQFMLAEIEAAARLGITHVQIDDGWQNGSTPNSVNKSGGGRYIDYYADGLNFWSVHPQRFPNGLVPVVEAAKRHGIRLGLWFSPDSADDFANWQRDADTMLEFYKLYDIRYFKLDAIKIKSKRGETNLLAMMATMVERTGGDVYFNLDTTAAVRQGYLCRTQYGGLFLENRYTDWRNYYPHYTLRNLWMLAKYVPSSKLQIEFLNVERNRDRYGEDPLAPAACGIAYSFAVSMMANPLAWMELTGLSGDGANSLIPLIAAYKTVQADLLEGHVLPIGDEPSGVGWTGFQSVKSAREGYILVFREYTEREAGSFRLWNVDPSAELRVKRLIHSAETAGATGTMRANASGEFEFALPAPFTFALYRYEC